MPRRVSARAHLTRLGGIRVSALFAGGCEGAKQLRLAYRFDEMYVKACVRCALAILLLPPSGQRDERHALAPRTQAYSPRGLTPVHLRHPEIEYDDIRLERLADVE